MGGAPTNQNGIPLVLTLGPLGPSRVLLGAGLAMLEDGQVQAQRRAGGELPVSLRLLLWAAGSKFGRGCQNRFGSHFGW